MKRLAPLLASLLLFANACKQPQETTASPDEYDEYAVIAQAEATDQVYGIVEEGAEPVMGLGNYLKWIKENIQYPTEAKEQKIAGKVFVQFIVEKDGSLSNLKVIWGIGAGCDKEAVRVLSEAPLWKPGKQRGKLVRQRMALPITFKLKA